MEPEVSLISPGKKALFQKIVNGFETGTPEGTYDKLLIYPDGSQDSNRSPTVGARPPNKVT
jgi:hypothetical protein